MCTWPWITGRRCLIIAHWSVLLIYLRFIYLFISLLTFNFSFLMNRFQNKSFKHSGMLICSASFEYSLGKIHIPIFLASQASSHRSFLLFFFNIYRLSLADIRIYHNFFCLKKRKFANSLSWRTESEMGFTELKWRCWQCCVFSRGSKKESISLPFPDSRGYLHSLACGLLPLSTSSWVFFSLHHSDTNSPASIFHL